MSNRANPESAAETHLLKIRFQQPDYAVSAAQDKSVLINGIEEDWRRIIEKINEMPGAARGGNVLEELKRMGQKMCSEFLTPDIEKKLLSTHAEYLILEIDEQLVHIPWELLYLNGEFLCQRFSMGRLPSTPQKPAECEKREMKTRLRMWILANPSGDLDSAAAEGDMICDFLDQINAKADEPLIDAELDSEIRPEQIRERIKDYDVVHFAGHAEYDSQSPSKSGWRLTDGNFTAADIESIAGGSAMPALVFSNACQSARTEKWGKLDESFGLANAFMLAGVRHYIGTSWEIKDSPGSEFARLFYEQLVSGKSVGESVRLSRLALMADKSDAACSWASYQLYGEPRGKYFGKNGESASWIKLQITSLGPKAEAKVIAFPDQAEPEDKKAEPRRHASDIDKKSAFKMIAACLIVVLFVFGIYAIGRTIVPPSDGKDVDDATMNAFLERNKERKAEIHRLWDELYKLTGGSGPPPSDEWTSPPLTIAFSFDSQIAFSEQKKEDLIAHAIQAQINSSSSFQLLHRKSIDVILQELIQSIKNARSIQENYRLKARLKMPTYYLFIEWNQYESKPVVLMQLVETESGSSVGYFDETLEENKGGLEQKERLSKNVLKKLKEFENKPIRGVISEVTNEAIALNVGEDHGVEIGQQFRVIGKDVILEVESLRSGGVSTVSVKKGDIPVKLGWKVESLGKVET
jgi:CHAT domain-containing protein